MGDETVDEFAALAERLHREGWATFVTVERLLTRWQRLAERVGRYTLGIDDYTNALTGRDALELVITWASPQARERITPRVMAADELFLASTAEDEGGVAVGRFFRIDKRDGWWWRRRPTTGPLSDYLDEHAS